MRSRASSPRPRAFGPRAASRGRWAPPQESFGEGLSWADLIALAGTTALVAAGSPPLVFCGGRTDAAGADGGSDYLEPKLHGGSADTPGAIKCVW